MVRAKIENEIAKCESQINQIKISSTHFSQIDDLLIPSNLLYILQISKNKFKNKFSTSCPTLYVIWCICLDDKENKK